MAPIPNRATADVLHELNSILSLRKKLEVRKNQQHLFSSQWINALLFSKLEELAQSTPSTSLIEGLENLTQMLDLHQDLLDRGFADQIPRITVAIVRQKEGLGQEGPRAEGANKADATKGSPIKAANPSSTRQPSGDKIPGAFPEPAPRTIEKERTLGHVQPDVSEVGHRIPNRKSYIDTRK
ncbi:MAG: hypothetical protein Q9170_001403 [Blastenia crenularia]